MHLSISPSLAPQTVGMVIQIVVSCLSYHSSMQLQKSTLKPLSLQPSRGDYIFRAQVHSYLNPTNHCAECGGACCDGNDGTCTSGERCDNVFLYCVRVLGTPEPTLSTLEDTASDDNRATPLQCIVMMNQ